MRIPVTIWQYALMALLLGLYVPPGQAGSFYEYIDISNPRNTIGIDPLGKNFSVNDVVFDAVACEKSREMICFSSRGIDFAVLKKMKERASWTYNGIRFAVDKKLDLPIFGRPGPFWLIKQERDAALWFLYSPTHGLVMLGGAGLSGSSAYVVMDPCGFGATKDCK